MLVTTAAAVVFHRRVRAIAVDWSVRLGNPGAAIWLAEVVDGRLRRLEGGRTREEVTDALLAEARRDPALVVGLDFAFSFPRWFVEERAASAANFWDVVAREGEEWLRDPQPPFWRTSGVPPLPRERAYRRTELELPRMPTSVFKLVGPGQVGPASIRGMPYLARLRVAFAVWPWEAGLPLTVEIWPRLLTGPVVKTSRPARAAHLATLPEVDGALAAVAARNDDAFDAAVSAIALARHGAELRALEPAPEDELEGRIWHPAASLQSLA